MQRGNNLILSMVTKGDLDKTPSTLAYL